MGVNEATIFASVLPSYVMSFGSPLGVWAILMGMLGTSAIGIWMAIPSAARSGASRTDFGATGATGASVATRMAA